MGGFGDIFSDIFGEIFGGGRPGGRPQHVFPRADLRYQPRDLTRAGGARLRDQSRSPRPCAVHSAKQRDRTRLEAVRRLLE